MPTISNQKTTMRPPIQTSKSKKGVLDRISPVGFDEDEGIKVLLYGQSGTGKTTLWSTFPSPILAIICSGGFRPGELRSVATKENKSRIKQVVLKESGEMKTLLDFLSGDGTKDFNTIVLDHVSGLQDLVLKEILGLDELPAQKSWGMARQQDYGTCTQQCKEYLRGMLNLRQNIVIVGQERTFGGKEDGLDPELVKPTVGVSVAPSLASWLNPSCDYVLQTFKRPKVVVKQITAIKGQPPTEIRERGKGVDYCVRTEAHDVYTTKFRVPKGSPLPDVIVDASYKKLISVIRGESAEE